MFFSVPRRKLSVSLCLPWNMKEEEDEEERTRYAHADMHFCQLAHTRLLSLHTQQRLSVTVATGSFLEESQVSEEP